MALSHRAFASLGMLHITFSKGRTIRKDVGGQKKCARHIDLKKNLLRGVNAKKNIPIDVKKFLQTIWNGGNVYMCACVFVLLGYAIGVFVFIAY